MSHRIQIYLTDEQYAFLREEADSQSVSIGELIRRAIETVYGVLSFKRVVLIKHTLGRRAGIPLDDDWRWSPRSD